MNIPAALSDRPGVGAPHVIALGPLTRSTDMLSGLLLQGDLHSLRVSETRGQLEAELAAEAVDVIVCEVSGDASEHLNLPVRLLRLYALNRLAKVPAVIWLSDLPAQTLDAQASELRDAGVGVEVASLVDKHSLAGALGRLAIRRPGRPSGAACPPARFTEDKLRQSVESGEEFRIVLQPQYDLATGLMVGAEALARWRHGGFGEIPPSEFLPALRRLGRKCALFDFVLARVHEVLRTLQRANAALPIAINASAATLAIPGLLYRLDAGARREGIPAELLKIELTEDVDIDDIRLIASDLEWMRARGFGISMDDFGTGTSTLERLTRLPFSEFKIDRSFVQRMHAEPSARAVVITALDLGRRLGMRVVAEGIERSEHIYLLRELGCQIGQGYELCRPLEVSDFIAKALNEASTQPLPRRGEKYRAA